MEETSPKPNGGKPRKKIDWDLVDKLCALHCTQEEIADVFECSIDAISDNIMREFGMSFPEYFRQKRSNGKVSLRRKQWEVAQSGNPTMLIWLGKQNLDQKDRQEIGIDPTTRKLIELAYKP